MMQLTMIPRMEMQCTLCKKSIDSHDENCPQRWIEHLLDEVANSIPCPKCDDGDVEINRGDFYECRSCGTQFTAGEACKTNKFTDLHNRKTDKEIHVSIMAAKGSGEFPIDQQIKAARIAVLEAREKEIGLSGRDVEELTLLKTEGTN